MRDGGEERSVEEDERRRVAEAEVGQLLDLEADNTSALLRSYALLKQRLAEERRLANSLRQQLASAEELSRTAALQHQEELTLSSAKTSEELAALSDQLETLKLTQDTKDVQTELELERLSLHCEQMSAQLEAKERELESSTTKAGKDQEHQTKMWEIERASLLQRIEELSRKREGDAREAELAQKLTVREAELDRTKSKLRDAEASADSAKEDLDTLRRRLARAEEGKEEALAKARVLDEELKAKSEGLADARRELTQEIRRAGEAETGKERESQKGRLVALALQSDLKAAQEQATSLRVQLDKALSGTRDRPKLEADKTTSALLESQKTLDKVTEELKDVQEAKRSLEAMLKSLEDKEQRREAEARERDHRHEMAHHDKDATIDRLREQDKRMSAKLRKAKATTDEMAVITEAIQRKATPTHATDAVPREEVDRMMEAKDAELRSQQRKYRDLIRGMKRKYLMLREESQGSSPEKTLSKRDSLEEED